MCICMCMAHVWHQHEVHIYIVNDEKRTPLHTQTKKRHVTMHPKACSTSAWSRIAFYLFLRVWNRMAGAGYAGRRPAWNFSSSPKRGDFHCRWCWHILSFSLERALQVDTMIFFHLVAHTTSCDRFSMKSVFHKSTCHERLKQLLVGETVWRMDST